MRWGGIEVRLSLYSVNNRITYNLSQKNRINFFKKRLKE